jgi:hypothetical protein
MIQVRQLPRLIFILIPFHIFSQNVTVIHYTDTLKLTSSIFIKEIKIKRPIFKTVNVFDLAEDSTRINGGDCFQPTFFSDYHKRESNYPFSKYNLIGNVYKLKGDDITIVNNYAARIDSLYKSRNFFQQIFEIDPVLKENGSKRITSERKEFFRAIPKDSVKKTIFEVGAGYGLDYILNGNINGFLDLKLLDFKSAKLSLHCKAGGILGFGIWGYFYPAIKYQQAVGKRWITASLGKEFQAMYRPEKKNEIIDYRIDLGYKFYKTPTSTVEIYLPIRLDKDTPAYFTGFSINLGKLL